MRHDPLHVFRRKEGGALKSFLPGIVLGASYLI